MYSSFTIKIFFNIQSISVSIIKYKFVKKIKIELVCDYLFFHGN